MTFVRGAIAAALIAATLCGCSSIEIAHGEHHVTSPEEASVTVVPPHWKVRLHTGLLHFDTQALHLDPRRGGDLGAELIWHGAF